MRVIGTAGHVDHGKTTLIEALTGINPDRLPEEKARGMTIDLGFAWFAGEGGEPVGVIDVPGHERFIRNMVAGAWSLDCALLLVAADDGWMQQTQDHAVVLAAVGVPAVILVVTKVDAAAAVSTERVVEVRRDALARCRAIFGREPECVEVSALARTGLESLKQAVIRTLAALAPRPATGFPFLYVDRVFTIKGAGLVVTGSLSGAPLARDAELELLPQGERVRIRALESYGTAVERAVPTCRLALNLQKTRSEIHRGDCLAAPGAPFFRGREMVARVHIPQADPPLVRNHSEVEVALGTGHRIAEVHFLDDRRFARFVLAEPIPALWNQPFLVIRHGGSAIVGSGRILWGEALAREDRGRLAAAIATLPDPPAAEDRFALELRFRGMARRPPAALDAAIAPEALTLERWVFHRPWFEKLRGEIVRLASTAAGIAPTELASKLRIPDEALREALARIAGEGAVALRSGVYFAPAAGEQPKLSPPAQKLLAEIRRLGRSGFDARQSRIEGAQRDAAILVRAGAVVPLEDGIYYDVEAYAKLRDDILAGRAPGDRLTVPQAKERTGLSRKFTLPILNRMEKDGLLRREGDERVVL